jgi:hypothetical protein
MMISAFSSLKRCARYLHVLYIYARMCARFQWSMWWRNCAKISPFTYTSTYCRPVHELGASSPYLGSTSRLILHAHAYFEREKQHKASMKIHNCKIIMHFLPLLE